MLPEATKKEWRTCTNGAWRWMQIRGEVVEITEEGALDHILDLALKYRGRREYDPAGITRVTYKIRPDHVTVFPTSAHQLRNR